MTLREWITGKKKLDLDQDQMDELRKIKRDAFMKEAKQIMEKKGADEAKKELLK